MVSETRMNDKGNTLSERAYTGFATPTTMTDSSTNRPTGKLRTGDPSYFETTNKYDSDGKNLYTFLPRGNKVAVTYDSTASERAGENNVTTVISSDEGLGSLADITSSATYESNYQKIKTSTDALGEVTTFYYDYEEATLGDLNDDGVTNGDFNLQHRRTSIFVEQSQIT